MKNNLFHLRTTNYKLRTDSGSALILTVVLTSLLAVIGVMFVLVTRVDKISTSAIIDNKELNLAADTVIAKISQQLILDVPHNDPCRLPQEYYDYPNHRVDPGADTTLGTPDDRTIFDFGFDQIPGTADDITYHGIMDNTWLANLEPEIVDYGIDMEQLAGTNIGIGFRHITDLYGRLAFLFQDSYDVVASVVSDWDNDGDRIGFRNVRAMRISPTAPIRREGYKADADGDGVADSRWVQLPDMVGSRGKPIYAAIRVIDNSAMLNVNTAYKFDPCDPNPTRIDGSSQTQINLAALSQRGANGLLDIAANNLQYVRCGSGSVSNNIPAYEQNVVWRYNRPNGAYTPFDISDELELKNRFLVNLPDIDARIEEVWDNAFQVGIRTPVDSNSEIPDWFWRANNYFADPNYEPNDYDYRHIGTTYNMDRIINAIGGKMANVNTADVGSLYVAIRAGLDDAGRIDPNGLAAQMAVNIKDYSDGGLPYFLPSHPHYDPNNDVSALRIDGNFYYGFEQPCIYISEVAHRFTRDPLSGAPLRSYAVELYKPYSTDADPNGWQLVVEGISGRVTIPIIWSGRRQYHVLRNQDPDPRAVFNKPSNNPIDPNATIQDTAALVFDVGSSILLQRFVPDPNIGDYITVDSERLPPRGNGWLEETDDVNSYQRDISIHKCISGLWDDTSLDISLNSVDDPTLGRANSYVYSGVNSQAIQAHPANTGFTSIGDIGKIFYRNVYIDDANTPTGPLDEVNVRVNLADTTFQHLFKYLTVFDPGSDGIDNDGDGQIDIFDISGPEWKVPGRININTAPWFVIAQLPWVSQRRDEPTTNELARAIVDHRNTNGAFESIGQLNRVGIGDPNNYRSIDYYARDFIDLDGFPDLDPNDGDGALGNFEERDVIFSRISNLVTVRSDVFTAYILVRIGTDGPQKRVIAILDRSDVYYDPVTRRLAGKVKIVSLHPVPDPR